MLFFLLHLLQTEVTFLIQNQKRNLEHPNLFQYRFLEEDFQEHLAFLPLKIYVMNLEVIYLLLPLKQLYHIAFLPFP